MKLSIITVNYNNLHGLHQTFESVLKQSCHEVEHIVVDAASTDGSVEEIQVYESRISSTPILLKWVSEKDNGIYDGMNKAIRMSSGDYLLFLNSGDVLSSPEVVKQISEANLVSDIVIGSVRLCKNGMIKDAYFTAPEHLSLYSMYLQGIPHQASLISREYLLKAGCYNIKYRISADWAFFLKAIILDNCSVQRIPLTICDYDVTGISSTQTDCLMEERGRIFREMFPPRIVEDYESILPHYYEVVRIQWLLRHPVCYKIYRGFTTIARKILK